MTRKLPLHVRKALFKCHVQNTESGFQFRVALHSHHLLVQFAAIDKNDFQFIHGVIFSGEAIAGYAGREKTAAGCQASGGNTYLKTTTAYETNNFRCFSFCHHSCLQAKILTLYFLKCSCIVKNLTKPEAYPNFNISDREKRLCFTTRPRLGSAYNSGGTPMSASQSSPR